MIERNFNELLVKREPAAKALIHALYNIDKKLNFDQASIYHQFPIYPNSDEQLTISANVIFLSKRFGAYIFQCVDVSNREELDLTTETLKLNEIDRLIFAKILKDSPLLQKNRRELKVNITPLIYINNFSGSTIDSDNFDIVYSENQLEEIISKSDAIELNTNEYKDLKATIEGSKAIPKPQDRVLKNRKDYEHSKGAVLSAIENVIYNFDLEQKRAALFIIDGAQRIRGLAGSGKTVILAMKAAIIHLQFPEAIVLYTYYTKSLNDVVKNLITRFYRQFADRDPDWNKIQIMHAWGGKYLDGVYYNACNLNKVDPINLSSAKIYRPTNPFDYVCEELNKYTLIKQYDYCLIDEAQDFPPNFYRICRQITQKNRVVWAYDDFQNILNIELQDEKKTFGTDKHGLFYIDFAKREDQLQDIVLYKCYRNPRKILISAFALGLGTYNKLPNGKFQMIQRLENNEHWESLGFVVKEGDSKNGSNMVIERPEANSSEIKNELLNQDEIINVFSAVDFVTELKFIVESIKKDIERELKPEDISVVCMDNRNVAKYFNYISVKLEENGIKCFNLLNVPTTNKLFKVKNHVTLSTIYNAKGNEAGSIYIAGIDAVFTNKNDITERNKIFTAMTRSLAWVTLSGVGDSVEYCKAELELLKKNDYELRFTQPSEKDVKTIRRGIDKKQNLLNKIERLADEIVSETGVSKDEIVEELKLKLYQKK